jgi:transporter family protein
VSTLEEETKKVSDNRWLLYASLSAVFASLTSILGKIGIAGIESNLGTAIRNIVVLIMAWVVVFVSRKLGDIKLIDKKSWLFICLSGITTGASWLCYYKALQKGLASVVVPIDKLSIVISVAFSYFFLKEKLTRKSLLGLIIIVIGTLLLLIK